jgi:hypothetical protein
VENTQRPHLHHDAHRVPGRLTLTAGQLESGGVQDRAKAKASTDHQVQSIVLSSPGALSNYLEYKSIYASADQLAGQPRMLAVWAPG